MSRRSATWCRSFMSTSSRASRPTRPGRNRCGASRRPSTYNREELHHFVNSRCARRSGSSSSHRRGLAACEFRRPASPEFTHAPPRSRAEALARLHRQHASRASPRGAATMRFLTACAADASAAACFAIGGELDRAAQDRATARTRCSAPTRSRALAPIDRNGVPRARGRSRTLRHRARSGGHRRR